MALEIKTASELVALDQEGRPAARRAARETEQRRGGRPEASRTSVANDDTLRFICPSLSMRMILRAGLFRPTLLAPRKHPVRRTGLREGFALRMGMRTRSDRGRTTTSGGMPRPGVASSGVLPAHAGHVG